MGKQVVLDVVEVTRSGSVRVKWAKQRLEDDGTVFFSEPHRTEEMPIDSDLGLVASAVNAHLVAMGWPEPAPNEWALVEQHAHLAWGRIAPVDSGELAARAAASQARDQQIMQAVATPLQAAIEQRDQALAEKDAALAAAAEREAALQAQIEALQDPAPKIVIAES